MLNLSASAAMIKDLTVIVFILGTNIMFWLREVFGWVLVAASLVMMRVGMGFAMDTAKTKIVEASIVLFAASAVLRAGILLIRISTAARICRMDRSSDKHES